MRVVSQAADLVVDSGRLPDPVMRGVVRQLLRRRLAAVDPGTPAGREAAKESLRRAWSHAPVALHPANANEQHYEVPTELFEVMLGPHLKYSSGWWPAGVVTLEQAEEAMLRLTCERADLRDGQFVLDLGCGWGSLTLWIARQYPRSHVTAVSNSATQRAHIEKEAARRGLDNVSVVTCDVNDFGVPGRRDDTLAVVAGGFDRIVSVEMVEHVRNHGELLRRMATWLVPHGAAFVHHFSHRDLTYPFETSGGADWMARHFFTGGVMPSHDWLLRHQGDLVVDRSWIVEGTHYARTLDAWLARLDEHRDRVVSLFEDTYGADGAEAWYHRWRVFTLACSELFAFRDGTEWQVSHHRLVSR